MALLKMLMIHEDGTWQPLWLDFIMVTNAKITRSTVNARDIAGNTEEEAKENVHAVLQIQG